MDQNIEFNQARIATYSDMVFIRFTEYTFNFEFSQMIPSEGGKKDDSICLGRIVMSPQHAKSFNKILTQVIEAYEKNINEIPLKK